MRTKTSCAVVAIAALLVLLTGVPRAVSQEDYSVFPKDLFPDPQRPVSRFNHEEHMVFDAIEDCYVCHHVYEDGDLVEGESSDGVPCGECHTLNASNGSVDRLRAYHNRCKTCHEKAKQGPIACGECHVRD